MLGSWATGQHGEDGTKDAQILGLINIVGHPVGWPEEQLEGCMLGVDKGGPDGWPEGWSEG